jgi:hypothetical protein
VSHFIDTAILSAIVLTAIFVFSRYPDSGVGRVLFMRLGPLPLPRERRSRYLLRWSRCAAGWFAQCVVALVAGWGAWRVEPALGASLPFVVLWLVVVPLLAVASLAGSLLALAAFAWRRLAGAERSTASASLAAKA